MIGSRKQNAQQEGGIFMKALIVICAVFCLPSLATAGLSDLFNPTALWQCRDSLQSLKTESDFTGPADQWLQHIPVLKKTLDRTQELLASPRFRIDVLVYNDTLTSDQLTKLVKRIEKKKYHVIATDNDSLTAVLVRAHEPFSSLNIADSLCVALIQQLAPYTDERHATIRELIKKVQTEFDLVSVGLAMKAYREQSGKIWDVDGVLVTDDVVQLQHFDLLLQIFKVQSLKL
ncbi:MAG: hypothetical protein COT25_05005 [Candidatus Kerfeldbacteria bacterium CG08_land_8_20_14_0_20_42_7]|uniref:Uncharacterized protein n=1 Tax=Candidatus Kerfeldbacteria bacterium CG08_land_8_20_14_0_20_42_7 TaxID=2014245 RepID=A0A2H0YTK2_9BACT|nr:MAG: hypothetical protein COT25_05005 [Candidatus Kerfeldbacteria bacterium CG08_land_8_20_14_0_20_42_7]